MSKSRRPTAVFALLVVTIIWGCTFPWMKGALNEAQNQLGSEGMVCAVGLFMCVRFGLATLLLPLVLPASRSGLATTEVWRDGLILAALLLSAFLLQMFGLQGVSPAVSAFLTSLYVAFTAVLCQLAGKGNKGRALWAGVILATFGAGFISGPPQLHFDLPEWLTVLCALLFALHILATDVITRRVPPLTVTLTSFAWVTLGSLGTLAVGLAVHKVASADLLVLATTPEFWRPALYTSIFGTLIALSLLNQFQRELDPVRAAILYALEPVWASLIAVALGMGGIDGWLIFGGGTLILGNLVAELMPKKWRKADARD